MSFLTAEWRKLLIANYEVEPSVLKPFVPYGTELDFWQGRCYVSLVGFMFRNTRLAGVAIPFHKHFEEVNLRFYVRCRKAGEWRRGVVFIKEIVPKAAITLVANYFYGEHYETLKMRHRWQEELSHRVVEYAWTKQNKEHRMYAEADLQAVNIAEGSEEEFITEHYWGYTKISESHTSEYEVKHPRWQCYPVVKATIEVDFNSLYGEKFTGLSAVLPNSIMLAEGSKISVEGKRKLHAAS